MIAWPLIAFGGTTWTTAMAYGMACALAAAALRVRLTGALDAMLALAAWVILLQSIPLPVPQQALTWLSPHRQALADAIRLGEAQSQHLALSIDGGATRWALAVFGGSVLLFWIARTHFARGGVRHAVRAVSALGFAASLLAVAQAATAGRSIYWAFPTDVEGPLPFGPFVNRNHFATWAIMAIPLCFGYLAARLGSQAPVPRHSTIRRRLVRAVDPRTAWLTAAGGTMLVALLLSLSRSGVLAIGVASALSFAAARSRLDRRHRRLVIEATVAVLVIGSIWADFPALARRAETAPTALAGRVAIWRESIPALRDFWMVGTGAGTYERAMSVYQHSDRTVYFNQAHNHYLQIAVEGGALLLVLMVLAAIAFVREAHRRIGHDTSGLVLIRIGAACGLLAAALQSVWETGLIMPANAALAALLAAIVVHERDAE